MGERFLERYNDELFALRKRAARFASAFPKIAGRLRMTGEVADDPHVERIIQSFAYSAARVRQKLDDEFPELTDSLLETLYPHYLAPLPSMSIVRIEQSPNLASVQQLPRHSEIIAEPVGGETCRFRTTQDVEIVPLEISAAVLAGQPLDAPVSRFSGVASCLKISLRTTTPRPATFAEIGIDRLQLFINSAWQQSTALYELLANHCVGIGVARYAEDPDVVFLPARNLRPSGFDAEQGMLPYPPTSFEGYRLLTEFFALPQKFLFLDVEGLDQWKGGDCELYLYLDAADSRLEKMISAHDLTLNATPIVNLFRQSCEPITLDGGRTEYRLTPDARRQGSREIYSIEEVQLTSRSGQVEKSHPFFGRGQAPSGSTVYWQAYRRFDEDDGSSDTDLAFVDPTRGPLEPMDLVASVDTLCLNRDLPSQLPYGGGHPLLQLATGNEAVKSIEALMPPTPAVRMNERSAREWRMVSHLLLNHLSLFDNGGAALKDILSLYAFQDSPETRQLVGSISRVEARNSHARIGSAMVPGTDVALEFDPALIDRAGAYIFGNILNHFFSLYTSINSFTRLTIRMRGQSEMLAQWPARAANRPLL
ncbi:type VI secretion system baseplate subunit TssF [Oryzifoliimicrobium ureilyticus]|uniref:type VI secretion system baseplate subunit TssF n=1 Tax=Oryzifoliimicrobium ureilyticus TaxID=3113724 RepID=UPI0030761503